MDTSLYRFNLPFICTLASQLSSGLVLTLSSKYHVLLEILEAYRLALMVRSDNTKSFVFLSHLFWIDQTFVRVI